MSIFENKEVEKMQEYRMTQITKADIVPTALRMRHEGRWLVMIHGQVEPDGRLRFTGGFPDADSVLSWVLTFGNKAELLEPEELRERLWDLTAALADRYRRN